MFYYYAITCNVIFYFLLCNLRASGKTSVAKWVYPHKIVLLLLFLSIYLSRILHQLKCSADACILYCAYQCIFSWPSFLKKNQLDPWRSIYKSCGTNLKLSISFIFSISHKGINIMWHFYYIFIPDRLFRHSNRIKHTIFPKELIIQVHRRDWYHTIQLVKCQIDWISRQNRSQDRQHPKLVTILT